MINKYFYANGILGEVIKEAEDNDWWVFNCINGVWRGEIKKDGKQVYVYQTQQIIDVKEIKWTGDELPCDGDYNVIISHIESLTK